MTNKQTSSPGNAMPSQAYQIHLNFLPLQGGLPPFQIFRRERLPSEKSSSDDVRGFWLKKTISSPQTDGDFWVSFAKRDGFDAYEIDFFENISLSKQWLLLALNAQCSTWQSGVYRGISHGMRKEVAIKVAN